MGQQTGRGAGYCADHDTPGYANPSPERGFGMGCGRGHGGRGRGPGGRGHGRRNMFRATGLPGWMRFADDVQAPTDASSVEVERDILQRQAEALQRQLNAIQERLSATQPTDTE